MFLLSQNPFAHSEVGADLYRVKFSVPRRDYSPTISADTFLRATQQHKKKLFLFIFGGVSRLRTEEIKHPRSGLTFSVS